jgi:hypothetical protein
VEGPLHLWTGRPLNYKLRFRKQKFTRRVVQQPANDMSDLFSSEVDIDFDRAASAFPDISLDGSDDFHTPAPSISKHDDTGFSFDDFDTFPAQKTTEVKVTGDNDIARFENDFPDIGVSQVRRQARLLAFFC